MNEFTYFRGEWSETNTLPEWDNDVGVNDWLSLAGYESYAYERGDLNFELYVHIYLSKNRNSYLADIELYGNSKFVLLPDFPSLMMFMRDYMPIFLKTHSLSIDVEQFQLLEKIFYLYHGHDNNLECVKCKQHKPSIG